MKKFLMAIGMVLMLSAPAFALDAVLTWTNTASTFGVQVERAPSIGGTYTMINQTAINASTYTDSSNVAGTTSCYRIAYFSVSGVGSYTTAVCKSFPAIPAQVPTSFAVN